jgi:DNA-binding transcriptional regulator LsrR (DeoR family)
MIQVEGDRWELLSRVAHLYYKKNRTQAEIAQQLHISRPQVSRLLAEGRDAGVVEITIHYPRDTVSALKQELLDLFKLKSVNILSAGNLGYSHLQEQLGVLAAAQIERELRPGLILGLSWNTGVYQVVKALQAARQVDVTVIQLTGAVGTITPLIDGPDLTRWLAQSLGARYQYLHAPLLADNPESREILLQQRSVQEPMALLNQMDLALVGIGSLLPALSSLLQAHYIAEAELREIVRQGGVGEICAYHYNLHGAILPLDLHQRIIGVDLKTLTETPCVVGVGGSIHKAAAILGALRLGVLDCLITDEIAARAVLKMASRQLH